MKRRLIVYDLDGTLADTREDIAEAANQMRARMNLGPLPQQEVCRYVGLGLQRLVENCLRVDGINTDEARVEEGMRLYRSYYSKHLLDHTTLYPAVGEVLEHFKERSQAVLTNKPNPYSLEVLRGLGVAHYFPEVVAGNSGWPKKPDPAGLLALMRRGKVSPEETLLIGDSAIDVETGARAGVTTVAVINGFSERAELENASPGKLVEDFAQLLDLAKEEGW